MSGNEAEPGEQFKVDDVDESNKEEEVPGTMDNIPLLKKDVDRGEKTKTAKSGARDKTLASQKSNKDSGKSQRQGASSPPVKRPGSITKSNRNAGNASPQPLGRRKDSILRGQ